VCEYDEETGEGAWSVPAAGGFECAPLACSLADLLGFADNAAAAGGQLALLYPGTVEVANASACVDDAGGTLVFGTGCPLACVAGFAVAGSGDGGGGSGGSSSSSSSSSSTYAGTAWCTDVTVPNRAVRFEMDAETAALAGSCEPIPGCVRALVCRAFHFRGWLVD
jgi:hypothetical protein